MTSISRLTRRLYPLFPVIVPILAVMAALAVSGLFLAVLGISPVKVYEKLITGSVGNTYSQTQTIGKATPLLLVALGICIAFRANVLNIGAEGQIIVGGLAAAAFGLNFKELSAPALIVLSLTAGFIAGGAWAGIPGVLKGWFGVNEILSTIMMNQIATLFLIVMLTGPMKDASASSTSANIVQSGQIAQAAWLPTIVPKTPFHIGAVIAVIAAGFVYFLLWKTVAGYRIRAVGQNPRASAYAGISVKRITLLAMVLSGGFAGLAGSVEVLGVTHRAIQDFSSGYGFSGIVVALFGGLHPIAAIPAALLFGGLLVGGNKLQSIGVSSAMVTVIEGLIVLFVVGSSEWVRRSRRHVNEPPQKAKQTEPLELAPKQNVAAQDMTAQDMATQEVTA